MAQPAAEQQAAAMKHAARFARAQLVQSQELQGLQLTEIVVARIPARMANQLIRTFGAQLPIPHLKHLKRVRKLHGQESTLDIVVCQPVHNAVAAQETRAKEAHACNASGGAAGTPPSAAGGRALAREAVVEAGSSTCIERHASIEMLPPEAAALVAPHGLHLFLAHVPANPPMTRAQWEEFAQVWPIAWKVPDGKAPLTGDELLASEPDQAYFELHMSAVLGAAQQAGVCNAARIVDPASKQVVGEGLDCRSAHPLDHATMVVVRAAAQRDLALWPQATDDQADTTHADASSGQQQPGSSCDEAAAKRQKLEMQGRAHDRSGQQGTGAGGVQPDDMLPRAISALPKPYMCTGYDVFLMSEPCIMCAMGLVHARLARVIYCHRDGRGGALGGRLHLMREKSLNHHYQVFHMPLIQS